MKIKFNEISEFFRLLYPQHSHEWLGTIWLEVWDLKTKHRKLKLEITSQEHLQELDHSALNVYQQEGYHFFYTCAFHQGERGNKNVTGIPFLWADVDHVTKEDMVNRLTKLGCCFPSLVVRSGHGFHLYWRLDHVYEPDESLQRALFRVRDWAGAPAGTTDFARLLRIPGTWNCKDTPVECAIDYVNEARVFSLDDILKQRLTYVEIKLKDEFKDRYILNGELMGANPNRSDRDYAVIKELLINGHTEEEVKEIAFTKEFAWSEKFIERGDKYFDFTFHRAKVDVGEALLHGGIFDDGVVIFKKKITASGMSITDKLSNFCVVPLRYLKFEETTLIEVLIRDKKICVSAVDLLQPTKLIDEVSIPGLAWYGSSQDWARYIGYLTDNNKNVKTEEAHDVVGWFHDGFLLPHKPLFNQQIQYYQQSSSNVPPKFIAYNKETFDPEEFLTYLPGQAEILRSEVVYPLVGWLLAAAFAPQIRDANVNQFPLMCLEGQPGSGKTTTITTFLQLLFGLRSWYSQGTTVAILRRAASGTNSIPLFIDEYEHIENHIQTIQLNEILRLSYNAQFAQKTNAITRDVDTMQIQAPILLGTSKGIEDEALNDRIYTIRLSKLPTIQATDSERRRREQGLRVLDELDTMPHDTRFLEWWLTQNPEPWISTIKDCKALIEASDRQRLAFAIPTAVLLYLAKKYSWPLTKRDCITFWNTGISSKPVLDPFTALDILTSFVISKNFLRAGIGYRREENQLIIHQAALIDTIDYEKKNIATGYAVTRKWLLKIIADGVQVKRILHSGKVMRLGQGNVRSMIIDLNQFPNTLETLNVKGEV